jgi:hypothetical protein
MSLALEVGILADLKGEDEGGFEHCKEQFAIVNKALSMAGLPEHEEPEDLGGKDVWWTQMLGYYGLHYLRRLAVYLSAGKDLPPPGDDNAPKDPLMDKFYQPKGLFSRKPKFDKRFDHLLLHGDAEGYYLPLEFEDVVTPPEDLGVAGWWIGSSNRLMKECEELAAALELPLEMDIESEKLLQASMEQGKGQAKWEKYGIESFTCLRLHRASVKSLELGAAIVFC